jgi:hypothetical protein
VLTSPVALFGCTVANALSVPSVLFWPEPSIKGWDWASGGGVGLGVAAEAATGYTASQLQPRNIPQKLPPANGAGKNVSTKISSATNASTRRLGSSSG